MKKNMYALAIFASIYPAISMASGMNISKTEFIKSVCSYLSKENDSSLLVRCPLTLERKDSGEVAGVQQYESNLQDGSTLELITKGNSQKVSRVVYSYSSDYNEGDSNDVISTRYAILNATNKILSHDESFYNFISSRKAFRHSSDMEINKLDSNGIHYTLAYNPTENIYVMIAENN